MTIERESVGLSLFLCRIIDSKGLIKGGYRTKVSPSSSLFFMKMMTLQNEGKL